MIRFNRRNIHDYITQSNIVRSKAKWYEYGEKNNKYFFNLENKAMSKTCIRKVFNKENKLIFKPKAIRDELYNFYADLYENKDSEFSHVIGEQFFHRCTSLPKLSDEKKLLCEGRFTYAECFKALNEFQNGKSPGNDGLSAEFYKTFWPIVGHLMVDSLHSEFKHGELSSSQKQGIIKLIDKKNKDRRHNQLETYIIAKC